MEYLTKTVPPAVMLEHLKHVLSTVERARSGALHYSLGLPL